MVLLRRTGKLRGTVWRQQLFGAAWSVGCMAGDCDAASLAQALLSCTCQLCAPCSLHTGPAERSITSARERGSIWEKGLVPKAGGWREQLEEDSG